MSDRTCKKCGRSKDTGDFYRHGGYLGWSCKSCEITYAASYQKMHRHQTRLNIRKANQKARALYPERDRAARKRFLAAHPGCWRRVPYESRVAQGRIRGAVYRGTLTRPIKCEWCGASGVKIDAHHADYSRPMEVAWVCRPCHAVTWRTENMRRA